MKSVKIEKERYYDSVFLMRISDAVKGLPEIADAVVALATPTNVGNLEKIGFSSPELSAAGPNDLVIAIDAADEDTVSAAFARVEELLREKVKESGKEARPRPATLAKALEVLSDANLVLISVPGAYAAREARNALRNGLHVMLFSDNVSVEDEVALKDEAIGRGLLMMGPDCGTAVINGLPLGFANAVRSGPIGIVGASGTGIQEITSLIHRYGGGRDRRTRPLGCCRREDDDIRDRGPGRRFGDGGHRRRLQGPGASGSREGHSRARKDG